MPQNCFAMARSRARWRATQIVAMSRRSQPQIVFAPKMSPDRACVRQAPCAESQIKDGVAPLSASVEFFDPWPRKRTNPAGTSSNYQCQCGSKATTLMYYNPTQQVGDNGGGQLRRITHIREPPDHTSLRSTPKDGRIVQRCTTGIRCQPSQWHKSACQGTSLDQPTSGR